MSETGHTFNGDAWAETYRQRHPHKQGDPDADVRALVDLVTRWRSEFPFGPGLREIRTALGFASTQTVNDRIRRGVAEGLLEVHLTESGHVVTRSLDVTAAAAAVSRAVA